MRRFSILLATLFFFNAATNAGMATPDRAMGANPQNQEERFKKMDTDGSGELTSKEFFDALPSMTEGAFTAIDADAGGTISLEEWLAFSGKHSRDMGGSAMPVMGGGPVMRQPEAPAPGHNHGIVSDDELKKSTLMELSPKK